MIDFEIIKSHLVSFLVTFVSSFLLAVLPAVGAGMPIDQSALFAIIIAASRTALKAALQTTGIIK